MRIAPVPLYFGDDRDAMFESAMAASIMTHRDVRSLSGALLVAHAVRRLVAGEPRDPSLLLWVAADVARDEERIAAEYGDVVISYDRHARALPRAIAHVESILDLSRERALAALVEEANRHGAEPACKRPTMGFPPACIPTCLYLLLTTDSFEEASPRSSTWVATRTPPEPSWVPSRVHTTESARFPDAGSTVSRIATASMPGPAPGPAVGPWSGHP